MCYTFIITNLWEVYMKSVTAAIIIENDKVLLTQRGKDSKLAYLWEFPGGKIEPNETPEKCLQRELREELNIESNIGDFFTKTIYDYKFGKIELLFYFAEIISGKIKLNVHLDYKWVEPSDILSYNLAPADIEAAKLLKNFLLK